MKVVGISLADFVASLRCNALDVHEERRLVRLPDSASVENSSEFRSVIFDTNAKTSRLEVSRGRDDGGALLSPRILHKMQEEGSTGLLAVHWLDQYAGLTATTN